jgi:hypothetical protein
MGLAACLRRSGLWRETVAGRRGLRPATDAQHAIEQEFLYRGASMLAVRRVTLSDATLHVEYEARPLYHDDPRLRYATWAHFFADQTLRDAAHVVRTVARHAPHLDALTVLVRRGTLPAERDAPVLAVRVGSEGLRNAAGERGARASLTVLQHCALRYQIDPLLGLATLDADAGDVRRTA